MLKKLNTIYTWKGKIVHDVIKTALRSMRRGHTPDPDKAVDYMECTMRRQLIESEQGEYRKDPVRKFGLVEHEYNQKIPPNDIQKIMNESAVCVRNFFNSRALALALDAGIENWVVVEDMDNMQLGDIPVIVVLDFAYRKGDFLLIHDWKTGKLEEKPELQMSVYALYAIEKLECEPVQVEMQNTYLMNNKSQFRGADIKMLEETRTTIRSSMANIREKLEDVENNVPRDEKEFSPTINMNTCYRCNFRRPCPYFDNELLN